MTRRLRTGKETATIAVAGCGLACGLAFAPSAWAQAVTQEMVVSVGGTVASNPYFGETDSGAEVGGTVEIRPRISYDTSVTQLDINAFARGTAYAENYGFEDDYGASAGLSHRASERLTLRTNLGFASNDSRSIDRYLWDGVGPGTPDEPLPPAPPINDITVLGQRGRATSITAGAGADYIIDARNSVGLSGTYQKETLTNSLASDHDVAGIEGRYSHVIDERTTVGLIASYRQFNYDEADRPDARSVAALGSLSIRLDEAWTLAASAGVQQTRLDESATAPSFTNTTITANGNLCRRDLREGFCIDYRREAQPTGFAGVRNADTIGMSYRLQVSEYDSVSLAGSYSRSSALDSELATTPATRLVGVRGNFEHRFNERFSGYVQASVDRMRSGGISFDPRARVGAGVRYIFGRGG